MVRVMREVHMAERACAELSKVCHRSGASEQPCWGRIEPLADPDWNGSNDALKFACRAHRTSQYKAKSGIDLDMDYAAAQALGMDPRIVGDESHSFAPTFSGREELARMQGTMEVPEEIQNVFDLQEVVDASLAQQEWARRMVEGKTGRVENLFYVPRVKISTEAVENLTAKILEYLAQIEVLKHRINQHRCELAGFPPEFAVGMGDPCHKYEPEQNTHHCLESVNGPGDVTTICWCESATTRTRPIDVEAYVVTPGRFRVRETQDQTKD